MHSLVNYISLLPSRYFISLNDKSEKNKKSQKKKGYTLEYKIILVLFIYLFFYHQFETFKVRVTYNVYVLVLHTQNAVMK